VQDAQATGKIYVASPQKWLGMKNARDITEQNIDYEWDEEIEDILELMEQNKEFREFIGSGSNTESDGSIRTVATNTTK